MKAVLKRKLLLVLKAWDGMPMPEMSLVEGARNGVWAEQPTVSDVKEALAECEAAGFVTGLTDEFSKERTWTLTSKGEHKARELGR